MQSSDPTWDPELVGRALVLLSGRWVMPVLLALAPRPLRRAALRELLPGVSDKILTATLRRLEGNGLVLRSTVPSVPIEVDYELTDHARRLWPVLSSVHQWAAGSPRSSHPSST